MTFTTMYIRMINQCKADCIGFIDGTENDFNAEIRIRDVNDQYAWYRITGTLVQDNRYGVNQRFVGKIECADQQITEERNLMQRAENDLLTGVLE